MKKRNYLQFEFSHNQNCEQKNTIMGDCKKHNWKMQKKKIWETYESKTKEEKLFII